MVIKELCKYVNDNSVWCRFEAEDFCTIRMDYQSYYSENPEVKFDDFIKIQRTHTSDNEVVYIIHKHHGNSRVACSDDYCVAFSPEEVVESLDYI